MNHRTSLPHPLVIPDIDGWREWLLNNEDTADGVWLMLAKKGVASPTSITYQDALEEALCSGWIDGQRQTFDAATFQQRFTPRRATSVWSERNVKIVERLIVEYRMRDRGMGEVEQAKADGRWERAYPGQATAEVPAELTAALHAAPAARDAFARLTRAARYTALHPILTAPNTKTRARRIAALITRLESR